MKPIAIIPARGGSKRLPRKNVLPVNGLPMLAYPVQCAKKSAVFDRVLVSTEDPEIKEVAEKFGAEVVNRPADIADDRASVVQVCQHVLDTISTQQDRVPDFFCCIYATALFITPDDILNSFQILLQNSETDFVMGVSDFNLQPVQALEEKDGFLVSKWPEYRELQSQFHPKLVASNGTLYWARTSAFLQVQNFYGTRLKGYTIPKLRAIDVDTQEDLEFAQCVAKKLL